MSRFIPIAALLALTALGDVAASLPPKPVQQVLDQADMLSPEDEQAVLAQLGRWKQSQGIEAYVATIESRAMLGETAGSWEAFATRLFNHWGIGGAVRNDGVLMLISKGDRKIRIETGVGFGRRHDYALRQIIEQKMTPAFQAGQPGRGIQEALEATMRLLSKPAERPEGAMVEAPEPRPAAKSIASPSAEKRSLPVKTMPARQQQPEVGAVAALAGGAGLGGWGLLRYWRRRQRKCGRCGALTQLLDENADDEHLDQGQRLEEAMGSVDYDVRVCPACAAVEVKPYRKWLTTIEECPACHFRTVRRSARTLVYADYNQAGSKLGSRDCQKCGHHEEKTVVIPRRVKSSGSSSSFGSSGRSGFTSRRSSGGRSSGGGASGGW